MTIAFCATILTLGVCRASAAQPWLFVNDIHFDPRLHLAHPNTWGDPSRALLESTLSEMRHVASEPRVIVMDGDFLPHAFKSQTAIPEMLWLAQRFNRAFPHAQFVIALGNEDSDCGDYALPPDSHFLRAVAKAWGPLVDRNGAAPDFARTFVHDGYYTAKLPVAGVRAVVVDNAYWSLFHHDGCGSTGDPTPGSLRELTQALDPAGTDRRWLVMHIPPGIDVSSTVRLTHRLAIVPFMRSDPRDAVLALIADPARRVELVITAHVHRFAFRIVERHGAPPVPLLIAPAISPIFGNAPSFLVADVGTDGVIRSLEEHSYGHHRWNDIGGTAALGASEFSGPALVNMQRRLEREPALRATFARLYVGGSRMHEITESNWRFYWCGATAFGSAAYRQCVNNRGFGLLTGRGVLVVALAALGVAALGGMALVIVRRRTKSSRSVPAAPPRP